jgi:putative transposase
LSAELGAGVAVGQRTDGQAGQTVAGGRECLDHLLITGPRHLTAVLQEYVEHYNGHRPHRALHQQPPAGGTAPSAEAIIRLLRRDRLGGLIHEYVHVA